MQNTGLTEYLRLVDLDFAEVLERYGDRMPSHPDPWGVGEVTCNQSLCVWVLPFVAIGFSGV